MNKCEIIIDLLPIYVENLASEETNEYIQDHIAKCPKCRKVLENMRENSKIENEKNIKAEEVEIRIIKKYKTKMKILKTSLILSFGTILLGMIIFMSMYMPQYIILEKSYNTIQRISKINNYKIITRQIKTSADNKIDYEYMQIHYYKDGKFKTEEYVDGIKIRTYYGDTTSDTVTWLFEDTKTKEYRNKTFKNNYAMDELFGNVQYDAQSIINVIGKGFREDNYRGKECYVIKSGDNLNYGETWIDKETMLPIRQVYNIFEKLNYEYIYSFEFDNITEQDLMIPNIDEYIEHVYEKQD